MRRALQLVLLAALTGSIGLVYAFRPLSYPEKREKMIFADLRHAKEPIVVFGDSITELAALPHQLCGHAVINAGIGGLRVKDFETIAQRVVQKQRPFMIVIALGANDRGSPQAGDDALRLLGTLQSHSEKIISVSVTPDRETDDLIKRANDEAGIVYVDLNLIEADRRDGVHLNAAGSGKFVAAISLAIEQECEAR
jgi:hypothetical protein